MSNHIDPLDLSGIADARAKSEAAMRLASVNEADDFKWLMSNKRGRRVVWRLLERTGFYRLSFNHSGSVTAFNEGARNMGLQIMAQIHEHCPEQYLNMLQEQRKDE